MTATFALFVAEFTTVPQNTVAIAGQPVCLSCDYPDRTSERWSRNGVNIDPPSLTLCNCTQQTATENLLCIPSPSANDTGQYTCSVTLSPGVGCTSPPATLQLAGMPPPHRHIHTHTHTHLHPSPWAMYMVFLDLGPVTVNQFFPRSLH